MAPADEMFRRYVDTRLHALLEVIAELIYRQIHIILLRQQHVLQQWQVLLLRLVEHMGPMGLHRCYFPLLLPPPVRVVSPLPRSTTRVMLAAANSQRQLLPLSQTTSPRPAAIVRDRMDVEQQVRRPSAHGL